MRDLFPSITGAGVFDSRKEFPNKTRSSERKVMEYEIELFSEDGGCNYLNGDSYPVRQGNLVVAKPGDIRFSDLHFRCLYLHIRCGLPQICDLMDSLAGVESVKDFERFEECFLQIESGFLSTDPFDKCAALGVLLNMLEELRRIKARKISETESGRNAIISRAGEFVSAHYMDGIGVSEIADACHVSASYLHRLFSETMGCTPHKVLTDKRIYMAKKLLVRGNLPIEQVAKACGFRSQSYFSDCFRRMEGLSPREFRERSLYQP